MYVNGGTAPRILDLDIRGRYVVSFTLHPLNPQGKNSVPNEGWVGRRTRLDFVAKTSILFCQELCTTILHLGIFYFVISVSDSMQIKAIERKLNPVAGMKMAEIEKCENGHRRF
jgi:hypothetical protein